MKWSNDCRGGPAWPPRGAHMGAPLHLAFEELECPVS